MTQDEIIRELVKLLGETIREGYQNLEEANKHLETARKLLGKVIDLRLTTDKEFDRLT